MNSVGEEPADFVIQPNVSMFDLAEFMRADEMSAIGEKTTFESIPELTTLLAKLDKQLFGDD